MVIFFKLVLGQGLLACDTPDVAELQLQSYLITGHAEWGRWQLKSNSNMEAHKFPISTREGFKIAGDFIPPSTHPVAIIFVYISHV